MQLQVATCCHIHVRTCAGATALDSQLGELLPGDSDAGRSGRVFSQFPRWQEQKLQAGARVGQRAQGIPGEPVCHRRSVQNVTLLGIIIQPSYI